MAIFVYVQAEQFKRKFFPLKLSQGWTLSKIKISGIAKQLTKLGGNKFYEVTSRRHVCCEFF